MKIAMLLFVVKSILLTGSHAAETSCDVVPIEVWGGSASRRNEDLPAPVDLVVVTHTVTSECNTDADCERLAINIRNNHINQGRLDISLSFLVGGNGKIYEGAGWKVGGHTHGYNNKSISVSFIGDFREKLPTAAALAEAQYFLGCVLNVGHVGCEYALVGHRQLINTISPGNALQSLIETWPHWTSSVSNL